MDGVPVSPYCSLPHQIDAWFRAFKKAKAMCGTPGTQKRIPTEKEIAYLDGLVRGVYAARDLPRGITLTADDVYLAIPLQKGQISCRELMNNEIFIAPCGKDQPVMIDMIDGPYAHYEELDDSCYYQRGRDRSAAAVANTLYCQTAAAASPSSRMRRHMKLISIVTPCYNEEENVEEVYRRVKEVFASLGSYRYEHIFIDNASTDSTRGDPPPAGGRRQERQGHLNSRNFGHIRSPYYAMLAGPRRRRHPHSSPTCRTRPS